MQQKILVDLGDKSYWITVQQGLLDRIGEKIREVYAGRSVALLTDENVSQLYADRAVNALRKAGYETSLLVLPAGEQTKTMPFLMQIYRFFAEMGLTRSGLVVTLGGGVIGDLGGFAAATYLRGIPFVQIPTSLLAQVDSSVGGKVAIDLPEGKNLVGAFWQPRAVLIDPLLPHTLSDHFFQDGMGEVIKTAAIRDESLFSLLETCQRRQAAQKHLDEIVARCCSIKKDIVERDEKDTSERMLLNFGHTIGHALEAYQHYVGLSHGQAVSAGMAKITRMSEQRALTYPGTADRLCALLKMFSLPCDLPVPLTELRPYLKNDKKNFDSVLKVVLLTSIGHSRLMDADETFFTE